MKIKVSELSIPQLNYAVALCEGKVEDYLARHKAYPSLTNGAANDWSTGGPIIEKENITLFCRIWAYLEYKWASVHYDKNIYSHGLTPLEAAMRCYVCIKLGDEVEIPDELLSPTN